LWFIQFFLNLYFVLFESKAFYEQIYFLTSFLEEIFQ